MDNNPLGGVDPNGHDGNDPRLQATADFAASRQKLMNDIGDEFSTYATDSNREAAAWLAYADYLQVQQQNGSSSGHSLWSHVSNLRHFHSWNYGMRESVTMKLLPPDFYSVNGSVGYFSGSLSYVPATNNLIVSPGGGTKSPLGGWPRSDSPEKVWVTGGPGLTLPTKSGCPMSGFSDMGCRM